MIRNFSSKTSFRAYPFLKDLGLQEVNYGVYRGGQWVEGRGGVTTSVSPHTNEALAQVTFGDKTDLDECVAAMERNKAKWMDMPMPARGEIVRQIGDALRQKKNALGSLISLEVGKIKSEGDGEV
jgi:aldehyde dehydrogenase family 7 protein A1